MTSTPTPPTGSPGAEGASTPLITTDLVSLDAPLGPDATTPPTKDAVLEELARLQQAAGRTDDTAQLLADIHAREAKAATGLPGGIAIPHCRTSAVSEPSLGFARLAVPADFGAEDTGTDLVFMILAPEGGGNTHMKVLSTLARSLVRKDFVQSLRDAGSAEEAVALITEVLEKKKARRTGAGAGGQGDSGGSTAPSAGTPVGGGAASSPSTGAPGGDGDRDSTTATSGSGSGTGDAAATTAPAVVHVVGVTACPTGIAHTYMAADSLTQAADARDDVDIVIEPQGSSGGTTLTQDQIDAADAVIFATDVGVRDRGRFAGKPVVEVPVKRGISDPDGLLDTAKTAATSDNPRRVEGGDGAGGGAGAGAGAGDGDGAPGWGRRIQQAVMTGVSYMIPFVAAGGLLTAIAFVVGGYDVANVWEQVVKDSSLWNLPGHVGYTGPDGATLTDRDGLLLYLGAVMFGGGHLAMGFLVPALSGYIAYALAGRPGIAPGFVGGAISVGIGAGFLGGLVTGIVAGLVALAIGSFRAPRWLAGMMPVVVIPLLATFVTAAAMYLVLGRPLEAAMTGLQNWLTTMSGSSTVLLGIILGLMMCFDLGGPVNKAAYLFATAGLSTGDESSMKIMAAVMAAGMVPPLALALATTVRSRLFTPAERENGKSSWLLGASFISEGAIPFAASDPLRVIPSMMVGGAVTGALSMALGAASPAPHGGIWVALIIHHGWGFVLAVLAGTVVSAVCVILVKEFTGRRAAAEEAEQAAEQAADAAGGNGVAVPAGA
ncbi:PTS lactose transporter subunit IIC [Corynebacterium bovis]|uniref:PTS lactose transporter subunit IIC n=11 Tax=Corynebacterium bovis TaxID=36808 RepID=A0A3R8PEJ7_9CORY|nr:fructose-specific PTS transporter subunit EIIC [Corynebacterium bovis]RRO90455.1 PTS lactose transporter subunit IIC [Corynebacterium bovis]RRQ02380.1 PTS lactose transporter subunit IIC [Corynebacterium bovis]RRQ02581.1 PTS lactose transporter subunit IIC [Corynebacterium bovis]RRQ02889.1 PTS lactose transporter subunit IIC [Corynebacterium bovis]